MRRKLPRSIYYGAVFFAWLLVFVLVLETGAWLFTLYMERTNPFIAAFLKGEAWPAETRSLRVKEAAPFFPDSTRVGDGLDAGSVPDASLQQVLAWGPRQLDMPVSEHRARQSAFPEFSHRARETYALLNGEVVFEFDQDLHLMQVYGGDDRELFSGVTGLFLGGFLECSGAAGTVRRGIEQAGNLGMPVELDLPFPFETRPAIYLSLVCFQQARTEVSDAAAWVFLDIHPERVAASSLHPVAPDSRWAVPYFRYKPHFQLDDGETFLTNSLGFRSDAVAVPKPENVFRILCIGGSTTEEGPSNNNTYPMLLQKRATQAFPNHRIEVVNGGTSGISSLEHLLRIPEYLSLEPDLVIVHVGVNDLTRIYDSFSVNIPPRLSRFIRIFRPDLCAPGQEQFKTLHTRYMGFNLELLVALMQRKDIALAFASIASPDITALTSDEKRFYHYQAHTKWGLPAFSLSRYDGYIKENNRILLALSERHACTYVPVAERLSGGSEVFTDFCHMTPSGIDAKARIVFEGIESILETRLR